LVEAGADVNELDGSPKGFNAVHLACAILHSGEYSDTLDEDHVLSVLQNLVTLGGDLL
jgi:hypothetical protein